MGICRIWRSGWKVGVILHRWHVFFNEYFTSPFTVQFHEVKVNGWGWIDSMAFTNPIQKESYATVRNEIHRSSPCIIEPGISPLVPWLYDYFQTWKHSGNMVNIPCTFIPISTHEGGRPTLDSGHWILDFASLDCTAWIQPRLQVHAWLIVGIGTGWTEPTSKYRVIIPMARREMAGNPLNNAQRHGICTSSHHVNFV
jgi:hypothetical protein